MVRRVCLAVAVVAGVAAALLSSTSPQGHYADESASCTALLVVFDDSNNETTLLPDPIPASAADPDWVNYQLARACDEKEEQRVWFTGLAVLVCLVAGSGARFAGRGDDEAVLPDHRAHEAV